MWPPPEPDCWLHPEVGVQPSPIAGEGLFALSRLPMGTAISRLGGIVVTSSVLDELLSGAEYVDTIAVDDGQHLVLPPGRRNGKGNHSCDPNLWWTAAFTLGARCDIEAGEELTVDYATLTANAEFAMECRCGASVCRGAVSGDDWRLPELWRRYGARWVPMLLKNDPTAKDDALGSG